MPAAANGAPIKIFLNYLPNFSNYGSPQATGIALVSFGEAWVDIQAEGLPQLSGQLYEAWLARSETNDMISLGKFNADASGRVAYHVEFEQLLEADYRYFFITVEPDPDSSPEADARRTIAGVFPNAEVIEVTGTPTPTLVPGVTPTPGVPAALPVTGDLESPSWPLVLGVAGLGLIFILTGLFYRRRHNL
jgi:hypothetical protein